LLKTEKVNLVTYADDTYVIICGDTNEELVETAEKTMVTHFGFLEKIGMVVNKSKTEATLFGKENTCLELTVDNNKITTESSMKVLGLIFNHDLDWSEQTKKSLGKARGYLKWLHIIRKFMNKEICLNLITAFYFSAVYYGAPVWMIPHLKSKDWKLLEASHYKAMRIAIQDYTRKVSRPNIDTQCCRATPRQWSSYITASTVIKILKTREPSVLDENLRRTMYINNRKPFKPSFQDRSKHIIGRNAINNRISSTFASINFDWYNVNLGRDAIRVGLKRSFFPYFKN